MNKDSSHSWVRISYGTVKYVIDSMDDENSEIPVDPQEEQTPPTSTSVVAARSKEKAKRQPREFAGTITTIEDGLILSHQKKILFRTNSRRKSIIFFDTIRSYIEKKMEQLNSAR